MYVVHVGIWSEAARCGAAPASSRSFAMPSTSKASIISFHSSADLMQSVQGHVTDLHERCQPDGLPSVQFFGQWRRSET